MQYFCRLKHLFLAISCALFFMPLAYASGEATGPRMKSCSLAADPGRCEARIAARKACRDKKPSEKKQCIARHMPPPDCSKAANPKRCQARQQRKSSKARKARPAKPAAE